MSGLYEGPQHGTTEQRGRRQFWMFWVHPAEDTAARCARPEPKVDTPSAGYDA